MRLTGNKTLEIGAGPHYVRKGDTFELTFEQMVAEEDLMITFTGLVLESYPPQLEIEKIKGKYRPVDPA